MSRPRNPIPSYRLHKKTGHARCTVYGPDGKPHDVSLGVYDSNESRRAYREILNDIERQTSSSAPTPVAEVSARVRKLMRGETISSLCLAFLAHAKTYYRDVQGKLTSEYHHYATVIEILLATPVDDTKKCRDTLGEIAAAEFSRSALARVREIMIGKKWKRQTINTQVRRIRSIFRWAEEQELVPEGKWFALRSLSGLKAGRTTAGEHNKVQPVSDAEVEKTLAELTPTVADMVRFHRLTGCRPQDVCNLEWNAIDRTGTVWIFTPKQHKTAHHGHVRRVWIGPAAQAILKSRLANKGFVFTPAHSLAEHLAARRAARETKLYASHVKHIEAKRQLAPKRRPKAQFTSESYATAIERACIRAKVPHWKPNQLRHTALTEFRKKYGLEVARVLGGHRSSVTTEIYAEVDLEKVLAAVGAAG